VRSSARGVGDGVLIDEFLRALRIELRVRAVLLAEGFKGRTPRTELRPGLGFFRGVAGAASGGDDDRGEDANDRDDREEFDQGKSARGETGDRTTRRRAMN
jgi:hypothetical protein